MNPRVDQEWTSSEVEEARSLITGLNNNGCSYDGDGHSKNKNKKHDIVDELNACFPWKTMRQVTDLYIDLPVETNMMQWQEENYGTDETKSACCTMDGFVNKKFGVPKEQEAATDGKDFVFGCPLEEKGVMEMKEALVVEKSKVEVLRNKMASHQPVVAPHARRFWTKEEHRLFLHGLRVYGRSQWKNISKYFVTTRTPIQVSSHAQKYFKRLESKGSGRKRYSINDVELHDINPWITENSSDTQQALAFTSASELGPSLGLQVPASTFILMKNNAQFLSSPFLKQTSQQLAWSEQQMVVSSAAPMEEAGGKQGSA